MERVFHEQGFKLLAETVLSSHGRPWFESHLGKSSLDHTVNFTSHLTDGIVAIYGKRIQYVAE